VPKIVLVVDLFVLAFDANTKLSTFLAFLEAEAIFLLAVRFFTCTEDEIFHARLIGVNLLKIMHIFAILLLDEIQNLILLILSLFVFLISLKLKSSSFLQILIFERDASGAALPYNTYLSWA